jgi:isopenicillin-N N-acyltransferase like protein
MNKSRFKNHTGLWVGWWFLLIFFVNAVPGLDACTLWGGAGGRVSGGGTLICKNRDWAPGQRQILELVTPEKGYRYFALRVVHPKGNENKAAINEKGLVVVTATVGSIPSSERKKLGKNHLLTSSIMEQCATVEEVLQHSDWFKAPLFLMIADRQTLAIIEIGPRGAFAVKKTTEEMLFHTNHYLDPEMQKFNAKIKDSSATRFCRIQELLDEKKGNYTLGDFATMSRDSVAGPDNSIWRTGSTPTSTRTLATWIVYQPIQGIPRLFVRIANPGEVEQSFESDCASLFIEKQVRGAFLIK